MYNDIIITNIQLNCVNRTLYLLSCLPYIHTLHSERLGPFSFSKVKVNGHRKVNNLNTFLHSLYNIRFF